MTAPTFDYYGRYFESLHEGKINFLSDPMYCMLVSSLYTPNQDIHQFLSDISGEITASGYTTGGQQVTGVSAAYQVSGTTKLLLVSAGNMNWPSFTVDVGLPAYAILYMQPAGLPPTECPLIGYLNFEGSENPVDEAFYINWNATGIYGIQIPVAG